MDIDNMVLTFIFSFHGLIYAAVILIAIASLGSRRWLEGDPKAPSSQDVRKEKRSED
jgi:hypothetical protein